LTVPLAIRRLSTFDQGNLAPSCKEKRSGLIRTLHGRKARAFLFSQQRA
jgi:hypothetical protein